MVSCGFSSALIAFSLIFSGVPGIPAADRPLGLPASAIPAWSTCFRVWGASPRIGKLWRSMPSKSASGASGDGVSLTMTPVNVHHGSLRGLEELTAPFYARGRASEERDWRAALAEGGSSSPIITPEAAATMRILSAERLRPPDTSTMVYYRLVAEGRFTEGVFKKDFILRFSPGGALEWIGISPHVAASSTEVRTLTFVQLDLEAGENPEAAETAAAFSRRIRELVRTIPQFKTILPSRKNFSQITKKSGQVLEPCGTLEQLEKSMREAPQIYFLLHEIASYGDSFEIPLRSLRVRLPKMTKGVGKGRRRRALVEAGGQADEGARTWINTPLPSIKSHELTHILLTLRSTEDQLAVKQWARLPEHQALRGMILADELYKDIPEEMVDYEVLTYISGCVLGYDYTVEFDEPPAYGITYEDVLFLVNKRWIPEWMVPPKGSPGATLLGAPYYHHVLDHIEDMGWLETAEGFGVGMLRYAYGVARKEMQRRLMRLEFYRLTKEKKIQDIPTAGAAISPDGKYIALRLPFQRKLGVLHGNSDRDVIALLDADPEDTFRFSTEGRFLIIRHGDQLFFHALDRDGQRVFSVTLEDWPRHIEDFQVLPMQDGIIRVVTKHGNWGNRNSGDDSGYFHIWEGRIREKRGGIIPMASFVLDAARCEDRLTLIGSEIFVRGHLLRVGNLPVPLPRELVLIAPGKAISIEKQTLWTWELQSPTSSTPPSWKRIGRTPYAGGRILTSPDGNVLGFDDGAAFRVSTFANPQQQMHALLHAPREAHILGFLENGDLLLQGLMHVFVARRLPGPGIHFQLEPSLGLLESHLKQWIDVLIERGSPVKLNIHANGTVSKIAIPNDEDPIRALSHLVEQARALEKELCETFVQHLEDLLERWQRQSSSETPQTLQQAA